MQLLCQQNVRTRSVSWADLLRDLFRVMAAGGILRFFELKRAFITARLKLVALMVVRGYSRMEMQRN